MSPSQFIVQLAERPTCQVATQTQPHNRQAARSDVPQCADEAIRGSLCVQGADVPNVQEAGHLIRHGGRSREERLQQDRMRFITVQCSVEMFPNYGKCHCFSTEMCRSSLGGSTFSSNSFFFSKCGSYSTMVQVSGITCFQVSTVNPIQNI